MLLVSKQSLADLRTDLLMSQAELARTSGVGVVTISRCETGSAIQLITAKKILKALNARRQEQGIAPLTVADLDWKIAK